MKVVGEQPDLAGTYLRTMFHTIDASAFGWITNFIVGLFLPWHRPEISEEQGRVIIVTPLLWTRVSTPSTDDESATREKGELMASPIAQFNELPLNQRLGIIGGVGALLLCGLGYMSCRP